MKQVESDLKEKQPGIMHKLDLQSAPNHQWTHISEQGHWTRDTVVRTSVSSASEDEVPPSILLLSQEIGPKHDILPIKISGMNIQLVVLGDNSFLFFLLHPRETGKPNTSFYFRETYYGK